jgi:hypothetical protein
MKNKSKNIINETEPILADIYLKLGEGKYIQIKAKFPILIDMEY